MFNTMKYAISDMLLNGSGYVYIQRDARGYATALEYVPASSITVLPDPNDIYNKKYNINCRGIGNVSAENLLIFTKNIKLDTLLTSLGLTEAAKTAKYTLTGINIDGKQIRVDIDLGFEEGRQYGRGRNGYQIRDEITKNYDPERPLKKNYGRQYSNDRNYGGRYNRYNDKRYRSRSKSYNKNRIRSRSRNRRYH